MTLDVLELLRDYQSRSEPRMSFEEHRAEKALNPGLGNYGSLVPGPMINGSRDYRSGMGGTGVKDSDPWFGNTQNQLGYRFSPDGQASQYDAPKIQPPPWISDVNMANVWYSPFQPIWPYGPPSITYHVEWNYPVG